MSSGSNGTTPSSTSPASSDRSAEAGGGAPEGGVPAIRLRGVDFAWPGRPPFRLRVPGFAVAAGERALLMGESGSGKSTLLGLVCGVVAPARGSVEIAGTDIARLPGGARDRFRAENIGVIFQMFNLLPYATPLDNVLLALRFAPGRRKRAGDGRRRALDTMAALGLPEGLAATAPAASLSVGQQQRVAAARALIGGPGLIVADEPTSALDEDARAAFLDALFARTGGAGAALLMVSHDRRLASRFDRAVELSDIAAVSREEAA